jgi:hypothetical protein
MSSIRRCPWMNSKSRHRNWTVVFIFQGATLKKQISVHLSKDTADSTSGSTSDSNTYYEDDFSSSEGTTDEDGMYRLNM